jgi:hypothetical protein
MATSFKREPKMMTTEPSVDEVKMKNGGKMMHGGKMKNGGKADMAQDKAMIKKAMKQHDAQEHKGGKGTSLKLRSGGMSRMSNMAPKAGPNVMGGLAGGLEATRPDMKKNTGGVRMPGYKSGGQALAAKGDRFQTSTTLKPPIDINRKPTSAKQVKGFNTTTGGVKNTTSNGGPAGYKMGGSIAAKGMATAKKYQKTTNTGNPMPSVKGGTKGIKQTVAGYKDGGHASMSCMNAGGFATNKKMQKC